MLDSFFFDTARRLPKAPALWVDDTTLDYETLAAAALRVADALSDGGDIGDASPCLLFAHRSIEAYAGLLGILATGRAYVPLGANFPIERNAAIAQRSGARTLLVDQARERELPELLKLIGDDFQVIVLHDVVNAPRDEAPPAVDGHEAPAPAIVARAGDPSDIAYILFTSGTTGVPKGVKVTHANASAYMRSQCALDAPVEGARYSQVFDLTFDLSVHDMFVCWANGACLYVPASSDPLLLSGFVGAHQLTHWGSVPSTASFLQQFRKLKPGSLPSLKMSMFCGEALPTALALAWRLAAPNSRILNLYGPTEATISCLRFEITHDMLTTSTSGVVPLGWSLPGEETLIVNDAGEPVADGEKGELLLGGTQVAAGYISDNPQDHAKFFTRDYPGRRTQRWYRTGDVASGSTEVGLRFHGRLDGQVKIRGNRVETQEVEHAVKQASDAAMVAVVAWPKDPNGSPTGLVAFISGSSRDAAGILADCRRILPSYALPSKIITLDRFPVNVNGKTDKNALLAWCQTGANSSTAPG